MTKTCRHHWACQNTTIDGTPAHCHLCGASTIIPPPVIRMGKWTGRSSTLPGMGLSVKRRMEMEQDRFHAEALAAEAYWGVRE